MEELLHEHGGHGTSFDTLVAAGPSGSSPHSELTDEPIPAGTLVIVDAGCTVDGYCSDCTRTFATGELPDELQRIYDVCLEAQVGALDRDPAGDDGSRGGRARARPDRPPPATASASATGSATGSACSSTRRRSCGRSRATCSSRARSSASSRASTSPGSRGVRIEDLVVLREDGPERLTTVAKELMVVD